MKRFSLVLLSLVLALLLMSAAVFAESETETETDYVMTVILHSTPIGFTSFEEGWKYALDNTSEYVPFITLYCDWLAGDTNNDGVISDGETAGAFDYEKGTDKGRLYISGCEMNIDLNGYNIDRGLESAVDSGQVFKLDNGAVLSLNDKSSGDVGCVTGGYNTGLGGAFYLEDGSMLNMYGGCIKGNVAKNGGGVGLSNGCTLHFRAGSIVNNHAVNGGGVALITDGGSDDEILNLYSGYIGGNTATGNGGGVYINTSNDSNRLMYGATHIQSNTASGKGGGIYLRTESDYRTSFSYGSIEENIADMGGGVYVSRGEISLDDTKILKNRAYTLGGGLIPAEINSSDNDLSSSPVIQARSGVKVYDNYVLAEDSWATEGVASNVYLGSGKCTFKEMWNGMPSATNALIGISLLEGCDKDEICVSGKESIFSIDTYKCFKPDDSAYVIVPREDTSLYYNRYSTHCVRLDTKTPIGIESVILAEGFECDTAPVIDAENKCVYITVNKDRRVLLLNHSLNSFVTFTFSTEGTSISESEVEKNFVGDSSANWQLIAPDKSYEIWYIEIMPEGGEWSDYDDSVAVLYVDYNTTYYYHDFEKAWADALLFHGSTLKLNCDFIAGDENSNGVIDEGETAGYFQFYKDGKEFGTNNGRLQMSGNAITIDLNGHKIDRALTESVDSGQVFKLMNGAVLEIKDDSSEGGGVITGGRNTGTGGGFYIIDDSSLCLQGGSISGNVAQNGGGIGIVDSGKVVIYGGSVSENEATNGGGIYVAEEFWSTQPSITVTGGSITKNTASGDGGGICYLNQSSSSGNFLTLSNASISENTAKRGGGVFVNMDTSAKLLFGSGTKIEKNTAEKGGGVYLNEDSKAYFENASIKNNTATGSGGGVYCDPSSYDPYIGGKTYIYDNFVTGTSGDATAYQSNMYLHESENNINHYTDIPLSNGAKVGIYIGYDDDEDLISGSGASFTYYSYRYFVADNKGYSIGHKSEDGNEIYVTSRKPYISKATFEKTWYGASIDVEIGGVIVDSPLVFAAYSGTRLVCAEIINIDSSSDSTALNGTFDTVKVMLLENCTSLKPISECKAKTFE